MMMMMMMITTMLMMLFMIIGDDDGGGDATDEVVYTLNICHYFKCLCKLLSKQHVTSLD